MCCEFAEYHTPPGLAWRGVYCGEGCLLCRLCTATCRLWTGTLLALLPQLGRMRPQKTGDVHSILPAPPRMRQSGGSSVSSWPFLLQILSGFAGPTYRYQNILPWTRTWPARLPLRCPASFFFSSRHQPPRRPVRRSASPTRRAPVRCLSWAPTHACTRSAATKVQTPIRSLHITSPPCACADPYPRARCLYGCRVVPWPAKSGPDGACRACSWLQRPARRTTLRITLGHGHGAALCGHLPGRPRFF